MTINLTSLFEKFAGLKVIIVGDVMLDAYLWGSVERISPEAPVPVVAIEKREERPGGAANVALNVKELGATPILCSVTGKDEAGKILMQLLKRNKMRVDGVITSAKRTTSVKTRVLAKNHQLLRYDAEMSADLDGDDEKKLLTTIQSLITRERPDALIFEDYNKGVLTSHLITSLIKFCRGKQILTAVDPKKKNFFGYKNADIFKPNLREVREAFDNEFKIVNESVLDSLHKQLKNQLHHKITMITLAEKGMYFNDGRQSGIIPAHSHEVSDVSGAGDTVIAAVVVALASGLSLPEAMRIANVAGGLVCEHAGVIPITREMLRQELS